MLEEARPAYVLYSSCNPVTLGRDLASMPSLRPVRARVFDMFPQTAHQEVLVLCAGRDREILDDDVEAGGRRSTYVRHSSSD